jgi:hypothetical protein
MLEPTVRILSRDGEECLGNGFLQRFSCSRSCSSQSSFELREGFLNGGEIR